MHFWDEIDFKGNIASGYFPAAPPEACEMGIEIAILGELHFSMHSGLIHRISYGIPYSFQMSWHGLYYKLEEPTAWHSIFSNHQNMTEMKQMSKSNNRQDDQKLALLRW
jgi:hypothetical protein